jgi:membrane-associated PAP2 superfamily phosphatase
MLSRRFWLIHIGGRDALRVLAVVAAALLLASVRVSALQRWRRPLAYFLCAMLASTLLVGALKQLTNVDCPWDLQGFGGTRPIVHLFADRPDDLPRAACFPGAHSSSGFALMCLYFLLRRRSAAAALAGLSAGIAVGSVFAFGQEARGAHFLSHDLCSALLVWLICLAVYLWPFRGNVAPTAAAVATPSGT